METKETYENRVVLFLDILGFKHILSKTTTIEKSEEKDAPEKISELYRVLYEMTDEISQSSNNSSKVITQFSDSIVVSFEENEPEEIFILFEEIQKLIVKLINSKIICRGAISYGKLIHTKEIIFGPALVDAYETESKAAMYPRVILDRSIVEIGRKSNRFKEKNIKDLPDGILEHLLTIYLEKDTDEKYYIDYFSAIVKSYDDVSQISKHLESLKKIILDGLKFKSPDLKVKYGWMKNKYNKMVDELLNREAILAIMDKPEKRKLINKLKKLK